MTREEAIAILKYNSNVIHKTINGETDPNEVEALSMAIKTLEQEPRWIPVIERLPEEKTAVLVWCPERKNIYCACRENGQWWNFGAYFEKITLEVIAWMPLPKAYEEKRGNKIGWSSLENVREKVERGNEE